MLTGPKIMSLSQRRAAHLMTY